MAFVATKPASNYTPPPAGMHIARCYRLIDLGTQPKSFQGKPTGEARKIMASWELLGRGSNGRRQAIHHEQVVVPFHARKSHAAQRPGILARSPVQPGRRKQLDVSKLFGAYCLLNVIQEQGQDGNQYTKIGAITPLMKECQSLSR